MRSGAQNADGITTPPRHSTPLAQNTPSSDEDYGWPNSGDEELAEIVDRIAMPSPETPRKAIKTDAFSTPAKRKFNGTEPATPGSGFTDVFTTPPTGLGGRNLFSPTGLPSPAETPTPQRFRELLPGDSGLATEILDSMRALNVNMTSDAITSVKLICDRHSMRLVGVTKGRDISRLAIKTKEQKITELQSKVEGLEAERETNRAAIRHLRREAERKQGNGPA